MCATRVHLQLVAMRKLCAADTLVKAGWLDYTEPKGANDAARYRLNAKMADQEIKKRSDPLGAALLFCEILMLFYRLLCADQGREALSYSRIFFRPIDPRDCDQIDILLLEASTALCEARRSRRPTKDQSGRLHEQDERSPTSRDAVSQRLSQAALKLRKAYQNVARDQTGAIDLSLAMILDLQACLAWQLGRIDEARRLVYEAISLLSTQSDADEIRLAVALKTAAMVEAAQSDTGFAFAEMWAVRSQDLFYKYRHPFEWRAQHQRVQCNIKANRLDGVEDNLVLVAKSVNRCVPREDDVERDYALAENACIESLGAAATSSWTRDVDWSPARE